jgi:hypothetical protein
MWQMDMILRRPIIGEGSMLSPLVGGQVAEGAFVRVRDKACPGSRFGSPQGAC